MTNQFQPAPFQPHRFYRGGHLQTIASIQSAGRVDLPTVAQVIRLGDGDSVVLHEDLPSSWTPGDSSILLVHGLCGCHQANYMVRLAERFFRSGVRVFRLDMRGCGAATHLSRQLTHAGRSADIIAALDHIASRTHSGRIGAIGVSLGGNQLLRALGRLGAGADPLPAWFDRVDRAAAVAPPIDLQRCSDNMQRWVMRPYNHYFIRTLLARMPEQVRRRPDFQQIMAGPRPKTLWQMDHRFTAPLSGFRDTADYYHQCSAMRVTEHNPVKTLVIAAEDDPVVPIACFTDGKVRWSESTELLVSRSGGHTGFIDRQGKSWMDQVLAQWFETFSV